MATLRTSRPWPLVWVGTVFAVVACLVRCTGATDAGLRYYTYDNCVNFGPFDPTQGPLQLEWQYNATSLQGRFSTPTTRGGFAEHDGFIGLGFQGDGWMKPTGHDNLLIGWPAADAPCIRTLYMNTSTYWHGYCLPDNVTLAIPNCTYAAQIHYNGTCRVDNATIPLRCYCDCDSLIGCWGPDPSCRDCVNGCSRCADGFGGSTCRIPVQSDLYAPDGANTYARLSFRRDLVNYNHTIKKGQTQALHLLWAYRHHSMFDTDNAKCADGVEANAFLNSPYAMVYRDTERVAIDIDFTSTTYRRRTDGSCKSAPIRSLGTPPIRHVYSSNAATQLGIGWISTFLHLGGTVFDGVQLITSNTIDDFTLANETTQQPMAGEVATVSGSALTWTVLSAVNGVWGSGSPSYFLHYYALALYAPLSGVVTRARYRHSHSVRAWLDGRLVLSADGTDYDQEQVTSPFNVTKGWHQLVVKQFVGTGDAYFRMKLEAGQSINWAAQVPFRCSDNPCLNGGTCHASECICTGSWNGERCETSYLWGEQFQNMRVAVLFLV